MSPRTHRSGVTTPIPQGANENTNPVRNPTRTNKICQGQDTPGVSATSTELGSGNKKHTISPENDAADPEAQPTIAKKARITGPVRPCPVHLELVDEDPVASNSVGVDPWGEPLQRTPSVYPGRGGPGETGFTHNSNTRQVVSDDEDFQVENEDDWMGDEDVPTMPAKAPRKASKFSKSVSTERPSWVISSSTEESSSSLDVLCHGDVGKGTSPQENLRTATTEEARSPEKIAAGITPRSWPLSTVWPSDTNLVYADGSNKLRLTLQRPLVQRVIQDAIDNFKASILFNDAFPDASISLTFARDALLSAAKAHYPATQDIQLRLMHNVDYITQINRVVRGRISWFRGKVKDECAKQVEKVFEGETDLAKISQIVKIQLQNYNYIFRNLSDAKAHRGAYRNNQIISVLKTLYFAGGAASFASQYHHLFQSFDHLGLKKEVPVPMVALVGTALYVSLYEWHTGEHRSLDFSANMFIDVYNGHIATLKGAEGDNASGFHGMMADIYAKASEISSSGGSTSTRVQIAQLDLNELV